MKFILIATEDVLKLATLLDNLLHVLKFVYLVVIVVMGTLELHLMDIASQEINALDSEDKI